MQVVALAAGLYAANAWVNGDDTTLQADDVTGIESQGAPEDWLMREARVRGIIAPQFQSTAARVPWDPAKPPYHMHRAGDLHQSDPLETTYQLITNALGHRRIDFEAAMAGNRPVYQQKTAQAIYNGFTEELSNPSDPAARTMHMQWGWLPKRPTDSDYSDAGAIAKALPPDPMLFTPDSYFPTASGMPFRYSFARQ